MAEAATRSRFPGFATVRVVCYLCGWYRILGYTGVNADIRALIRVERARSPCNVLWAKVVEIPADRGYAEVRRDYPQYRDLQYEWDHKRHTEESIEARLPYWDQVKGQACPRCKRTGGVSLEVYKELPQGRSSHVACWLPGGAAGILRKH